MAAACRPLQQMLPPPPAREDPHAPLPEGDDAATPACAPPACEPEKSGMVTVFSDPVNFNVVHPLHNAWTLWYDNPAQKNAQASWSQNLKELITFDTVEEFWGVYNNVVVASNLPVGATYHFFKRGIMPMWEDPANEKGGRWTVQYTRRIGEEVSQQWLNALLACVGEHFDHEEEVCGVVLGVRKAFFRLSLWTRTATDKATAESVGRQLKAALGTTLPLEFFAHDPAKFAGRAVKIVL